MSFAPVRDHVLRGGSHRPAVRRADDHRPDHRPRHGSGQRQNAGNARRFVSITELGLGQRVRVWSRGVILQSYPPQTGAGQVDILER
ncbi:MAG: DUF3221 domain-containing protein [Candidatus Rokuibacteriota bacterium]